MMRSMSSYGVYLVRFVGYVWKFLVNSIKYQAREVLKYQSVRYPLVPLSPLSRYRLCTLRRKILVLDLDETLIHSSHDGQLNAHERENALFDFTLRLNIDRHPVCFYINKRPHVDYFLDVVSQWYDLVVFTASVEMYGMGIADYLDNGRHLFQRRYYRPHCILRNGCYSKDLSLVSSDLTSVFILDNSPHAYRGYPDNAIPIKSWFSDYKDNALLCLLPVLDALRFVTDVRSILSRNLHRHQSTRGPRALLPPPTP